MSSYPSIEDLIWLFEVEPDIQYEDLGWPQSDATFDSTRGAWRVSVLIDVYSQDLMIKIWHSGEIVVDVWFKRIVDRLAIDRSAGRECLGITFVDRCEMKPATLTLKPSMSLMAANRLPWEIG